MNQGQRQAEEDKNGRTWPGAPGASFEVGGHDAAIVIVTPDFVSTRFRGWKAKGLEVNFLMTTIKCEVKFSSPAAFGLPTQP
jgi:hypothetical protein